MVLPPKKEQAEIIHLLEKTTSLQLGEPVYLISTKWYNIWKEAVGYINSIPREVQIPEIDNSNLLNNGSLRDDVYEGADFSIITKPVWDQLITWYGGEPVIPINTEFDPSQQRIIADIRIPTFHVYNADERRPFKYSIYHNIGQFKEKLCDEFHCDPEQSRLCDFHDRERNIALDDQKSFADYPFFRNGELSYELLLENQKDDGRWITVKHTKRATTGPQMVQSPSMQTIVENSAEPGVCGLSNLGNTCYLNAAVQSLVHIPTICEYFLKNDEWRKDINYDNPIGTKGEVVECFRDLLIDIWNGFNTKISPRLLKSIIGHYIKHFNGQTQQDSHEFLISLLDKIHEDLNRVKTRENVEDSIFGNGTNDLEVAQASWQRYKKVNDSFIVDHFQGLLRSRLICPNCNSTTIVFDSFMSLTVPLPIPKELTIPFIFVPYDLTKPKVQMQIATIKPASILEYCEAISQKIQQDVIDIMFTERTENSNDNLRWRSSIPSIDSAKGKTLNPLNQNILCSSYAYEIPHHSDEGVFICVRLISFKEIVLVEKKVLPFEIDGIFLVEIHKPNPSNEDIKEACENRFNVLFTPTQEEIPENLLEIKESICENPNFQFLDNELIKVSNSYPIEKERHSRLTTGIIDVILNPSIIKDQTKFNWNLIKNIRIIKEPEIPPEERLKKKVTLEECLNIFQQEDTLDMNNKWLCPHCRKFVCAKKKMEIWSAPEILIIQLKRFLQTASGSIKLDVDVKYPNYLDLSPLIREPQDPNLSENKYKLQKMLMY
ncbi:Clan CA, family C19, ubiquitin hydrolase-like cysteine peptidase [Histomonas meleagridis]|uniref:Clan CA, family C19, ubiquitin hydrolase-like cysteine peptidase n=1 Tax=Histomonas meleagridis TaxID=135588 RepID=UPI00355A5D2E|nr:Clan CA, family C19, ubiquitin hydrolase-like cysteine peptidase [Histomonas meleagridis]KAH0806996.1 Clan CA, family C19, ubiquitin hydrolase-like cysteine peptidase [Histomonas meleagridis]